MSSSDDSESARPRPRPRPAAKQTQDLKKQKKDAAKDAEKTWVLEHKTSSSMLLAESCPPVTKKDLRALIRNLKPSIDDHIDGDLCWTENMINRVDSKYINSDPVVTNRDKKKPDSGLMLYRTCLRFWRRLPTQIITPINGLVFVGKNDAAFLNDPMQLNLKWSQIFNKRLTSLLVHPAWSHKLHYFLAALAFASMCKSNDRRLYNTTIHSNDIFSETWVMCQGDHYTKTKSAILDEVEKSLKAKGHWPNTICQVLQAIALQARLGQASTGDDDEEEDEEEEEEEEEEGEEEEEESDDGVAPQEQSIRGISANHLRLIELALDNMKNCDGMPTFYPTKQYYHLFSASREGGTYKSSDYPTAEGYQELLKQARIGLLYDAYAYKVAWEEKKSILCYVAEGTTRRPPLKQGDRGALDEDQGGPFPRRDGYRAGPNTAILPTRRKLPRDTLAEKNTSKRPTVVYSSADIGTRRKRFRDTPVEESSPKRPKRATNPLRPGETARDASLISLNKTPRAINQNVRLPSSSPFDVGALVGTVEDRISEDSLGPVADDSHDDNCTIPEDPLALEDGANVGDRARADTVSHHDMELEIRTGSLTARSVVGATRNLIEPPSTLSQRPVSEASAKTIEERIGTFTPVMARSNFIFPIASPVSHARSERDSRRLGHSSEGTEYENVHPSRAALMRQNGPDPGVKDQPNERGSRISDYSWPTQVQTEKTATQEQPGVHANHVARVRPQPLAPQPFPRETVENCEGGGREQSNAKANSSGQRLGDYSDDSSEDLGWEEASKVAFAAFSRYREGR